MNIKRVLLIQIIITLILSVSLFFVFDYTISLGVIVGSCLGYFCFYSLRKKINELTDEEIFIQTKQNLINDLYIYDSSKDVNIFYINNIPLWLDKITRAGLMLRLQAELSKNINETSIWFNSIEFKLTVNEAINLLYSIEVYASKCYDTTQQHINNINNITTMDELKNYNYKLNYPEKLFF